jgi:hypothetical protein
VRLLPGGAGTRSNVFDFTLVSSVEKMWESRAYTVAAMIVVGSAIWPYVKMLAMLGAWFTPVVTNGGGERRRGRLARALDILGKWSLIDGFVMVMLMVGFRLTIAIFTITVVVEVTSEWAVTASMIASAWSALQSHALLFAHHRAARHSPTVKPPSPPSFARLSAPSFARLLAALLALAFGVAAAVTGYIGATQYDCIRYEFSGFAGGLVSEPPPSFTLVELGRQFLRQGLEGESDTVGVWIIAVGYFAFTMVLPSVQLLAVGLYVVADMTASQRLATGLGELAALLATWSALDIFVLAGKLNPLNLLYSMPQTRQNVSVV